MTNNLNNNPSNNNNYRAIASVTAGVTAGIIAGATTDRIINRNQQNNQTPGTTEHYTTKTTGGVSRFIVGAERTVERTALPQEASVHLKRRTTQTIKEVEASFSSPASRETQTIYENTAKINVSLSTSGLVVGAIVGVAVGLGTNHLLKEREEEEKRKQLITPQAINQVLEDFKEPDLGRLCLVKKMYYKHLKNELKTTQDKAKILKIKIELDKMAKEQAKEQG